MATSDLFAKRLTQLRKEKDLKRQQVADDLCITRASLEFYEKGKRKPDIEMTARIAKYFQVSADYLLGLSDTPSTDKDIKGVCDYTGLSKEAVKKIVELKKENTDYLNNGEFNMDSFVDYTISNFINEFIANGELYYMSLLANDYILENHYILSVYSSAIEKLSKNEKIDFIELENKIETANEKKDLSLFKTQRSILNFFDDITSDIQDKVNKAEKAFIEIKRLSNGNNTQEE